MFPVPVWNQQGPGPPNGKVGMKKSIPGMANTFLDLFNAKPAEKKPPHYPVNHNINFVTTEPQESLFKPLYGISMDKLLALNAYIEENLAIEFIGPSSSPDGELVLFIKKFNGSLHQCVDYRGLHTIKIKNRYPHPLI